MATQKKLEKDSQYEHLDLDGDGIVTDEELDEDERMMRLENEDKNEDKKQDAQRNMAWFALFGMLLYPFAVVIASWIGLDQAGKFWVTWHRHTLCLLQRLSQALMQKKQSQRKRNGRKHGKIVQQLAIKQ